MVEGPRMSTHACIPLRTPDPDVRDRVGHSLRDPVGRRLPVLVVRILDSVEEFMDHGNRTRDVIGQITRTLLRRVTLANGEIAVTRQIGRASCRERVGPYV